MSLDNTHVKGTWNYLEALFRKDTCLPLGTAQVKAFLQYATILGIKTCPYIACALRKNIDKKILCTLYIKRKQVATVLSPSANRTQYKTGCGY